MKPLYQPGYEPNTATITIPRRDMITLYKLVSAKMRKVERERTKRPWDPALGKSDTNAEYLNRLAHVLEAIRQQVGDPKSEEEVT
jgi:hypothetical protein